MSRAMRRCLGVAIVVSALAFSLLPMLAASAHDKGKPQPGVGQYAQLTALWWQWVFSRPAIDVAGTNTNPVLDSTGEFGAGGQRNGIGPADKYFFLAGNFGGVSVRTLTVPRGKTLFFPILNYQVDNAFDPPTDFTVPELRAMAKARIDSATLVQGTLDGRPLKIFRVSSPTFSYTLPDRNSIYAYFGLFGPQFEGRVKPVVSDGYWSAIPPLRPGRYVLKFQGANSFGFSTDVTYYLKIK